MSRNHATGHDCPRCDRRAVRLVEYAVRLGVSKAPAATRTYARIREAHAEMLREYARPWGRRKRAANRRRQARRALRRLSRAKRPQR